MGDDLFFSVGDYSGDLHASEILGRLLSLPGGSGLKVSGLGGDLLARAGCNLLENTIDHATVGFQEVVFKIKYFRELLKKTTEHLRRSRPRLVVLVDNPGFNLRLASICAGLGLRTVYFIPPQAWAWHRARVSWLRRCVEEVYCILPFEESFFGTYGIAARYVGNPLVPRISRYKESHPPGIDPGTIGVFPGSRISEWERHFPVLRELVELRRDRKFLFSVASALQPLLQAQKDLDLLRLCKNVTIVRDDPYEILNRAEFVLCASGTITLETALFERPATCFYRTSWFNYRLARFFVQAPGVCLPNLILYYGGDTKPLYDELIQGAFTVEELSKKCDTYVSDPSRFSRLRQLVGEMDPVERVSDRILELV